MIIKKFKPKNGGKKVKHIHKEITKVGTVGLLGLAGGPDLGFGVKWWDSPPPSGNLEPANQHVPSKKQRES